MRIQHKDDVVIWIKIKILTIKIWIKKSSLKEKKECNPWKIKWIRKSRMNENY